MSTSRRVLLDTCVIIDFENAALGEFETAEGFVSSVTMAELAYGMDTGDPVERQTRMDRYFAARDQFEVLAFDEPSARFYGTLAALVRQAGHDPRPRRMDLQIAATAAAHGLPLLTRNPKDFVHLERVVRVFGV